MPKNIKRVRDVLARRAAGESWSSIGKRHGISRMGAKLLYERWCDKSLPEPKR